MLLLLFFNAPKSFNFLVFWMPVPCRAHAMLDHCDYPLADWVQTYCADSEKTFCLSHISMFICLRKWGVPLPSMAWILFWWNVFTSAYSVTIVSLYVVNVYLTFVFFVSGTINTWLFPPCLSNEDQHDLRFCTTIKFVILSKRPTRWLYCYKRNHAVNGLTCSFSNRSKQTITGVCHLQILYLLCGMTASSNKTTAGD